MKTTIIVEKRGEGYILDLFSDKQTKRGERCGLTPLDVATNVSRYLAQQKETGASLVAPAEVKDLIPKHLHDFDAE